MVYSSISGQKDGVSKEITIMTTVIFRSGSCAGIRHDGEAQQGEYVPLITPARSCHHIFKSFLELYIKMR